MWESFNTLKGLGLQLATQGFLASQSAGHGFAGLSLRGSQQEYVGINKGRI